MKRRDFLLALSSAVPLLASRPIRAGTEASADAWRRFELRTHVAVADPAGPTRLWLPIPLTESTDYQRLASLHWDALGASRAKRVRIPGYDVELLAVEWSDPSAVGPVDLVAVVETRDREVDLGGTNHASKAQSTSLAPYLRATKLLPTDGIVKTTADQITRDRRGNVEKAQAIYEWVVEHTNRDPNVRGCGVGDVGAMLESGYLGGKCADINALFVALARASAIPARDAYGVRVAESRLGYKCLGKSGDISKAQHCRAEFYAEGHGWVPVDPADVRKVVLEESGGLPIDDAKVQAARKRLFGAWEMNWVAFNHGHDVALPGADSKPIPFLMYPNAETRGRRLDSLDPATFKYEIRSTELT
jgi:transglutaminase-like putative cysteine protease